MFRRPLQEFAQEAAKPPSEGGFRTWVDRVTCQKLFWCEWLLLGQAFRRGDPLGSLPASSGVAWPRVSFHKMRWVMSQCPDFGKISDKSSVISF